MFGLFSALTVVAALSLADGAPGTVDHLIRAGFSLANRIDPFGNVELMAQVASESRGSVPYGADTIGHFIMWGGVGFLAVGLCASVRDRFSMLCALFALSSMFEAGQQYLSWSRTASFDDLVANGLGLVTGYLCFSVAEYLALPRLEQLSEFGQRLGFTGRAGGGSLR